MKHVKRQKFVIGNWKMHTNAAEAGKLAKAIAVGVGTEGPVSTPTNFWPSFA